MITKDIFLALFVILFSIAAYIVTLSYPYESAYFPRFIIVLLGFLGLILLIKEIRNRPSAVAATKGKVQDRIPFWHRSVFRKVASMIGSSLIYLIVLNHFGFFVSTLVYLPVMIWTLGVRKPKTIIFSTAFVVFFIFLIFQMFLRVPFPEGLLY